MNYVKSPLAMGHCVYQGFEEALPAYFFFFFSPPLDKLRENTERAYKTKVQDSLDLLPEQVIFKKQQKLDD